MDTNKAMALFISLCVFLGSVACSLLEASTPAVVPTDPPTRTAISTGTPTRTPYRTPTPTPTRTPLVVLERPAGRPHPLKITDSRNYGHREHGIPSHMHFPHVFWVTELVVDYGGGAMILAGSSNGLEQLVVDDEIRLTVVHQTGRQEVFFHTFGGNAGPELDGPFDLSDYFEPGKNLVFVELIDTGYGAWSTTGLWLVEFRP